MSGISSHTTGTISELCSQVFYLNKGYEVFVPLSPQSKCDFIATKGSRTVKVQVKTATENPTKFGTYLQVRLQGKPTPYGTRIYTTEDFDELVIVYKTHMWILPSHLVMDKTSMTFGKLMEDGPILSGHKASVKSEEFKVI